MNKNIKKTEKDFDAVKMMRKIRDKISQEIMNMTYQEEKEYLKQILSGKIKLKTK